MPRYVFKRSLIFEDKIDNKNYKPVTVKIKKTGEKGIIAARSKLGDPGTGRRWVLYEIDGINVLSPNFRE